MKRLLSLLLLTLSVLCVGCDAPPKEDTEAAPPLPEIEMSLSAEYHGTAASMRVLLPQGWDYEKIVGDRGALGKRLYGLRVYPKNDPTASALFTYELADCVPAETATKQPYTAQGSGEMILQSRETDDGNIQTLITYTALPGTYYMQYTLTPTQQTLYDDAMLAIANSALLADGVIRQEDALRIAADAHNQTVENADAVFHAEKGQWTVKFYRADGKPHLAVILNKEGKQISCMYID